MAIYLGNNKIGAKVGNLQTNFKNFIKPQQGDVSAPTITAGPTIDQITTTSFRVTWSLNEGSQGQIEYGPTLSYGNFTTREFNYLTTHIQTVSGLTPGTEYNFRILGQDAAGNILTGPNQVISTNAINTPVATILATDNTATEAGLTTGQFTVSLDSVNNTGNPLTINYSVSGTAIPAVDYITLPGTVSIPNGSSSATIVITPLDDNIVEGNETVTLTLTSGSGYTVGAGNSDTVNITSDDSLSLTSGLSVTSTDKQASKSPSVTNGTFRISASNPVSGDVVVNYSMTGTAINGTDYTTLSGTATITNGNSFVDINITPINNNIIEPEKTVVLTLESGSGYTLSKNNVWDYVVISNNKNENLPVTSGTSTLTSLSDFTNPANAGTRATVTGSFNASGATAAANMVLVAGGGIISGTNINLNGCGIENSTTQLFSPATRFSTVYDKSRLYPEIFGASGNGVSDDNAELDALIINCKHAIGRNTSTYVKNEETVYTRSGDFDWNMNGCTVSTTTDAALSHGTATSNVGKYLFDFQNISPYFYGGGIFEGNNEASRCILMDNPVNYHFNNITIRNYFAPPLAYARGVAIRGYIKEAFREGHMYNTTIDHIGAASNNNANDAPYGISKGFWVSIQNTSTASYNRMADTTINDIYGDDAEGFYPVRDSGSGYSFATTPVQWFLNRVNLTACQRRAIKVNASNLLITNTNMISATNDWIFSGAQAATLNIFTLSTGQLATNVNVFNCTISTIGDARNALFGINDAKNCRIEDNIFSCSYIMAQRSISFGVNDTQGGLYAGILDNVSFKNNTTTNTFLVANNIFVAQNGGVSFTDNTSTINIDRNIGSYWAALRYSTTSGVATDSLTISNWYINVIQTFSTGQFFGGVLNSQGQEPRNLTLDRVTIDYTGSTSLPTYPFCHLDRNTGNFPSLNSSNIISNCRIIGASGLNSMAVDGPDKTAQIINSFGDSNSPITIVGNSYVPTSAADMSSASNASKTAIITNNINLTGVTLAANQTIHPNGGILSGTNINLNNSFINNTFTPLFNTSTTFNSIYTRSALSPESFGAVGNGVTPDDNAITALIAQCSQAIGDPTSIYVKNEETTHDRSGSFSWDMNGSEIRTTSAAALSHGSTSDNDSKYLFEFGTLSISFSNGIFNGQNLASRCIWLHYVTSYNFDNITIQNYLSPANAYARGVGLKIEINDIFTGGSFLNGVIENIGATSDGNANNTPFGVSKGISLEIGTQNLSNQLIQNSRIENIYGDDAEGFYMRSQFGFSGYNHQTNQAKITFNNCEFIACQRRALKVNASNCDVINCYIESATNDWIFSGAQAASVHVFPLSPQSPLYRFNMSGTTIKTIGDARNPAFAITEAYDSVIENNIMEANYIMLQRNVAFGNGSNSAGANSGFLDSSIIFRNNVLTNFFILLNKYMISSNGGMTFTDNIININLDRGIGGTWAAFRNAFPAPMDINGFNFSNTTINVNQSTNPGSTFGGVLLTEDANLLNTTWNNIDINYTGSFSRPTYPFMIIGTNPGISMNNTNTISNCNITGDVGTGAIGYTGSFNANIVNSTGDGSTPITAILK